MLFLIYNTKVRNIFMKTKFIYCLICPKTNILKYIGKSKDPIQRLRSHLSKIHLVESTKKNNWLV